MGRNRQISLLGFQMGFQVRLKSQNLEREIFGLLGMTAKVDLLGKPAASVRGDSGNGSEKGGGDGDGGGSS